MNSKGSDKIVHFQYFTINRAGRGRNTAAVVDGAQGVESGGGMRDDAVLGSRLGGAEQVLQEIGGKAGHVTGDDQVPGSLGGRKGGVDAAERAAVVNTIREEAIAQGFIAACRGDQGDVSGGALHQSGDAVDQGAAVQREERFVAAHTGAAATGEHEAGARWFAVHRRGIVHRRVSPGLGHEMMIAYVPRVTGRGAAGITARNKMMYICFVLIAMLTASPVVAADASAESKTLVVRVDPRSGRLVRTVTGGSKATPKQITDLVDQAARAHDVDPLLVHSMIKVESNYDSRAVSPKGAQGLMQLTPSTAKMLGVRDSFDPQENIEGGVKYLKYLQGIYKDPRLALAAYNAGPGAVEKYRQIPPYPETQNYVKQVSKRYSDALQVQTAAARQEAAAKVEAPAPVPQVLEDKHPKLEQFIDENGRLHLRTTQ